MNMYNLTGITSKSESYCAVWIELTSGREGNDIASAFVKLFKNVVKHNAHITDIVCWSESCVPKNKNSYMSQAILESLLTYP